MARVRDNTGWSDKDYCLDYWIETNGQPDFNELQRLLPRRKLSTLRSWIRAFNRGDRSIGYPGSARKRVQEILTVLHKIGASAEAIENAKIIADESVPLQGPFLPPAPVTKKISAGQNAVNFFFYNTDERAIFDEPQPRYSVLLQNGFAAAGGARKYGERFEQLRPGDILLMYENHVGVVAFGRVMEHWDGVSHNSPQYYTANEIQHLDGGPSEYRIAVDWFRDLSDNPIGLDEIKARFGNAPRGVVRRIVKERAEVEKLVSELRGTPLFPEEVAEPEVYVEGATRQVSVNAYERNRDAVRKCKEAKGTACIVCGFDFGLVYGSDFDGFIHVHHLWPLSEIGREYIVDPVEDLCPVCPNCHAVIHYGGKLRKIEEVRALFRNR